jgi:hypothetical protein
VQRFDSLRSHESFGRAEDLKQSQVFERKVQSKPEIRFDLKAQYNNKTRGGF